MQIPISQPFLTRRRDNLHIQKGPIADDGSTAFFAHSFVKLASGLIVPVLSAGVACYGWCADKNHAITDKPPEALYGNRHWVFNPREAQFEINVSNGGTVGAGGGTLANVAIGTQYGIIRPTSGTYAGYQMLDYANTTNLFFTVVGFLDNQATTDLNPRVLVELVPAAIVD